ncbi:MAG TPA: hypothetical protein VMU42_10760, partial [Candidatus Sulfotelmatobacter sp.]|nr:hypothetical protein [Candidatus Sulfotelmatobacter sp.]
DNHEPQRTYASTISLKTLIFSTGGPGMSRSQASVQITAAATGLQQDENGTAEESECAYVRKPAHTPDFDKFFMLSTRPETPVARITKPLQTAVSVRCAWEASF